MAWYGVMSAKATGEQLPNQIAVYPNGESATDPDAVLSGKAAILPFGTVDGWVGVCLSVCLSVCLFGWLPGRLAGWLVG